MRKEQALKILCFLKKQYPSAKIAIRFENPTQLLVATILSAQCTDKRVNIVTSLLFKKYKTIKDYASANRKKFESEIRSTGFYRNKAKNIIEAAKIIRIKFNNNVPDNMKDLISLPGVARKTANIILQNAYGKVEGIAVDTHVRRLSQRIGFTKETNQDKIENDLMNIFPRKYWSLINYLLVEHGRTICHARKPKCAVCIINKFCGYFTPRGTKPQPLGWR